MDRASREDVPEKIRHPCHHPRSTPGIANDYLRHLTSTAIPAVERTGFFACDQDCIKVNWSGRKAHRGCAVCGEGTGDLATRLAQGKCVYLLGALPRVTPDDFQYLPLFNIHNCCGFLIPEHHPRGAGFITDQQGRDPALFSIFTVEFLWVCFVDNFPEKRKKAGFSR